MNTPPPPPWKKTLAAVGSLRVAVIGLALLIVLTLWGTLYQAEHGLYRAQQKFYQSWFFLGGDWLPFPGAQTVMLILLLNLAASMIYLTIIRRNRWGLLLTHGGLLLMLLAGAVTFYFGSESQLTLTEGEARNVSAAYHTWELAAWSGDADPAARTISAVDAEGLRPGTEIRFDERGVQLSVEAYYPQSTPTRGQTHDHTLLSAQGWTGLNRVPPAKEPVRDQPGVILRLTSAGGQEARALLWAGDGRPVVWQDGDVQHLLMLRRKRVPLPAVIELIDFQKSFHPDSQIAKSFSSLVRIQDGESERQVLISMNKPLRYRGFTFFQSSYQDMPGGRESSTLAVVRNYGRLMPYIATGVTVVGMLLHFTGMLIGRLGSPAGTAKEAT